MTAGQPGRVCFAALGTTAVVLSTDPARLEDARAAVAVEVAAMDRAASRFRADSDLSRVNAGAGRPVEVDPFFIDVLDVGLDAAELTDGAVDPTIGQHLVLLGYDADFAQLADREPDHTVTGAGPVVRVGARRGPSLVRIDRARHTVHIPIGIRLDLGATAKAQCADRAAAAAAAATGAGVLVSLGGDLAVAGACPPDGWTVLVTDRHDAPLDGPGQAIALHGGGLATSSVTVRHWQHDSAPAHHLIDPASGRSAEVVWRTVSVAAASCVAANIASTAAMIKGDTAPAWLASLNLPARLIGADGTVQVVAGWPDEEHRNEDRAGGDER